MRLRYGSLIVVGTLWTSCSWDWDGIDDQIARATATPDAAVQRDGAPSEDSDAARDADMLGLDAAHGEADASIDGGLSDASAPERDATAPAALSAFGPAQTFIRAGATFARTFPEALSVELDAPAPPGGRFVAVTSSDPTLLSIPGGGVTVSAGDRLASVELDAFAQAQSVTLTAALEGVMFSAQVRVLGVAELPKLIALEMRASSLAPGGVAALEVVLDIPSPVSGTSVELSLMPPHAGSVPATVIVPVGETMARFLYRDARTVSDVQVRAAVGVDTLSRMVPLTAPRLVINELDHDQYAVDTAELIEVLNKDATSVALANHRLGFVSAAGKLYRTVELDAVGSLAGSQRLVVAAHSVITGLPNGTAFVDLGDVQNQIVSGGAIVLFDPQAGVVLDAVAYGGMVSDVSLPGIGTLSVVEGGVPMSAFDQGLYAWIDTSLCRFPDGTDTDHVNADFRVCTEPAPGRPNIHAPAITIDEIDYSLGPGDSSEFVEVGNHSDLSVIALDDYSLHFFDGTGTLYRSVDLQETFTSGMYCVVVAGSALQASVSSSAHFIDVGAVTSWIADVGGIVLVDRLQSRVVDAISYGVSLTGVSVPGVGVVSLVEGTATPALDPAGIAGHSLCRDPAVNDTNDATSDWTICSPIAPGYGNHVAP